MTLSAQDPALVSASELVAAFKARTLSPVEVLDAVLARIARFEPAVNAFRHVDHEGARAAAREAEARWAAGRPMGRIDGVPITVKDNIAVAGQVSRFGSRLTPDTPQAADAPAVARLRGEGAVIVGKTNMPEYGWKATSDSPLTGLTRNPWDTRMTTGGSSSGAAAAAVLGMGALHLGTDGGGSVRIPASFTGCFGIKPTRARVPAYPASPLGTLAHTGPLTRTVADAALALSIIAAPDARDVYAWIAPAPDFTAGLADGVKGLRIAYSPTLKLPVRNDPEVARAVAKAAALLAGLGAHVEETDPSFDLDQVRHWDTIWWSGMATQMAPFWDKAEALGDPGMVAGSRLGRDIPASALIAANLERARLHAAFAEFHQRFDLLITPTLPVTAFEVGKLVPPGGAFPEIWTAWAPYSYPFNLTQQPAASVPCGLTAAGLPIGLQIIGPIGADAMVLRAAHAFEQACPPAQIEAPRAGA
ncbi:MAG: amidase [Hyphomicrobiaceae bacterium]|nr:amidase [Hyphomicrobiaceae bacterium]